MIKVAIAEDHQALIDGIESYLKYMDDIHLVGHANDGESLIQLVRTKLPDLVLCDIRMPRVNGIEATKIIKKEWPQIEVLAFTMFDQNEAVQRMLDAGAKGYILKNSSLESVLKAIRTIANGEIFLDKMILLNNKVSSVPSDGTKSILSKRERLVLAKIAEGCTSQEIANLLFIQKSTVDTHRKNMIRKLGLSGTGELLRYAMEKKYDF